MNETLWNSTEEGIGSIILGGVTFLVHFYAILISSAIYDYQGGFQLEFASISQGNLFCSVCIFFDGKCVYFSIFE